MSDVNHFFLLFVTFLEAYKKDKKEKQKHNFVFFSFSFIDFSRFSLPNDTFDNTDGIHLPDVAVALKRRPNIPSKAHQERNNTNCNRVVEFCPFCQRVANNRNILKKLTWSHSAGSSFCIDSFFYCM